jgi:hypothetical protein
MIKIKDVSNEELKEYLAAYQEIFNLDPHAEGISSKIKSIKKALHNRELLGITVKPKAVKEPMGKIKNFFKKKNKE